ncbi:MAG: fasciclin domain-containing protein [Armatimonadetes bacterium]|nr:fasciclin domain-containing protein [Armatimonadota bacterium]
MKKLAVTSLVTLVALVSTVSFAQGHSAKTKTQPTIIETAIKAGSFKTLVSLVKAAGLVDVLNGKGPFTVFAPTDAAFAKVPKELLAKLGKDKNLLKKVLTYHVVSGSVLASTVVTLSEAKTVQGGLVKIKVENGTVFLNGTTKVIKTDIKASNGVIHVIDSVLLPPSK